MVGKYNPQPIRLSLNGLDNISRSLLDVEMVQSAGQAVTGEGICIGINYKTRAFVHPKTARSQELIKQIVDEVRSHEELLNVNTDQPQHH